MISVQQAVQSATSYLRGLAEILPSYELRLEEVEFAESANVWFLTLSFLEKPIASKRIYKIFRIDADSGKVQSMKVRTLQPVE